MGYTITKTTNGRFKIESGWDVLFIPAADSVIKSVSDKIYITTGEGEKLAEFDYGDIDAPLGTTVTPCTFDYTGGGVEDEWTKATHGLTVGDRVIFTAIGTGASPYTSGVEYYVVSTPDGDTFQLSLTKGGAVVEGTADSVGTWTLTNIDANDVATAIEGL